jgi:Zn-dependent protease with chaperone function
MDIAAFFSSSPGQYATQSFLHAFIAAIIVDRGIAAWGIHGASIVQRFRLIVVVLPIVSFPLYQLINPERGSVSFRLQALFDSQRWLNVELWRLPVGLVFLFALGVTAIVFVVQELIPVIAHSREAKRSLKNKRGSDNDPLLKSTLAAFRGITPAVFVLEEEDHVVFSTAGNGGAIFLSSSVLRDLSRDEIQGALAHEIAHVARSRRTPLIVVFVLRAVMFFNPVTLLEFRKIVHEEEKICDDIAVSLTGKPRALAATLRKLYGSGGQPGSFPVFKPANLRESLEEHGHHLLVEDRIRRLEHEAPAQQGQQWSTFLLTIVTISVINYFVV